MAQIDLKLAIVRLKDGYGENGSVNGNRGLANTSMNVTFGIAGGFNVSIGDTFTIGVNTTVYTISAANASGGNTTDVVFTPALGRNVATAEVVTILPHSLYVKIGEGNLTWTEKKARQYYKDRGILDTVRNGDQDPVEVKLDATWEFLKASSGNTPTVEDAFKNRGEASNWVTSANDVCEPFAVDIEIEYSPPCGVQREIITLGDFRYEDAAHDLKAGTLSFSGKCNVTEASIVRSA